MKAVVSTQWGLPVRTRTLKTTTISFTNHKCHCWIAGSCLVVKLYCHCQCLQPILFLNYARSVTQINQVLKTGFCYLVFIYMLINNISICLKKKEKKKRYPFTTRQVIFFTTWSRKRKRRWSHVTATSGPIRFVPLRIRQTKRRGSPAAPQKRELPTTRRTSPVVNKLSHQ